MVVLEVVKEWMEAVDLGSNGAESAVSPASAHLYQRYAGCWRAVCIASVTGT